MLGKTFIFCTKLIHVFAKLLALILLKVLQPLSKAVQRHVRAYPVGIQIVIDHRTRYQLENFVYR
jgi:hypothetical protein